MTLPEDRKYFNSPSVYRGSTAKPGGSLKNTFLDSPFFNVCKFIVNYCLLLYNVEVILIPIIIVYLPVFQ